MSEQHKLFASLSGALVVHLFFFLFVFVFLSTRSANSSSGSREDQPDADKKKREVTVLMSDLMEQITVDPAPPTITRTFVTTDLNLPEPVAPANAPYESDRNTSAASALSPDLSQRQDDGPTLKGNSRLPNLTLANRDFRDGDTPAVTPASPASSNENKVAFEVSSRPSEVIHNQIEGEPTPNERKSFSDPKTDPTASAEKDHLASEGDDVSATGASAESLKKEPLSGTAEESSEMSNVESADNDLDSENFQPEERQNVANGKSTKVGQDAVDAEETPLGRYKKEVRDVISAKWHRYRQDHADSVTWGILKLEFNVDQDGRVNNLQITKNEANAILVEFSLKAIREAKLPPMPVDVAESVGSRGLLIRYDIITY